MFTALYADQQGNIFDALDCRAAVRHGTKLMAAPSRGMIPIPSGTDLMYLPGRTAVVNKNGKPVALDSRQLAVAAILPVGYTRTYLPAFIKQPGAPLLPLYGYTAVAVHNDELYVAAFKSDDNEKWNPHRFNSPDLTAKVNAIQKSMPDNRIVSQLAQCSLKWHCCTAQNLFYHRWEAGIPTSPVCNANCLGCISLQPAECCPSPQSRIQFSPTAQEIAEVGIYHLESAPEPIISFGQGCEGEPSLAWQQITEAIRLIRRKTSRGIINMNSNAGFTAGVKSIIDAGLDSMRVSMISAIPETYQAYYRAQYDLDKSIVYAKQKGVYVSVNLLLFPGMTDRPAEIAAWHKFIKLSSVDMIQLRNLNIDPDWFLEIMPVETDRPVGVKYFVQSLAQEFPKLAIGNFSHFSG